MAIVAINDCDLCDSPIQGGLIHPFSPNTFNTEQYAIRRRRLQPRTERALTGELRAAPKRCLVRGQSPPLPGGFAFSDVGRGVLS